MTMNTSNNSTQPTNEEFAQEIEKIRYQAEINKESALENSLREMNKLLTEANIEREKADWNHEYALDVEIYKAYIEIAKTQIDRARASAEFIQKVAIAIGTAYAGILALTFGVGEHAKPLPLAGVIPTIFFGLSLVYVTFYIAYLTNPEKEQEVYPSGTLSGKQTARRNNFIMWVGSVVLKRKEFMQASVISLGIGIIFFPSPYLDLSASIMKIPVTDLLTNGTLIGVALTLIPFAYNWGVFQIRNFI